MFPIPIQAKLNNALHHGSGDSSTRYVQIFCADCLGTISREHTTRSRTQAVNKPLVSGFVGAFVLTNQVALTHPTIFHTTRGFAEGNTPVPLMKPTHINEFAPPTDLCHRGGLPPSGRSKHINFAARCRARADAVLVARQG